MMQMLASLINSPSGTRFRLQASGFRLQASGMGYNLYYLVVGKVYRSEL